MSNIKFSQLPNLGNLTAATIIPVVASGINYTVTAANLQAYTSSTTGNVTAGYFLGNGSQLTGLPATYTNSNVTTLLASFGSNTISTTGNITTGYVFGNGSQLTGIPVSYSNANVNTLLAAWGSNTLSTTGTVTVGNLNTGGAVSAVGNITGAYILGNGSQLTGLAGNYGNSNVTTLMAAFGSNTVSTSGNVTAGNLNTGGNVTGAYILGNGSLLTGLAGNYGNSNVTTLMAAFGANTISSTGNITAGNLNTGGNVTGVYFKGSGSQLTGVVTSISAGTGISVNQSTGAVTITNINPGSSYGDANVTALLSAFGSNTISTTGNVTAGYVLGNGSQLTGIVSSYGNANVNTLLAAWGSNALSTTGTVTASYHVGNGSSLTGTVTSIVAGSGISISGSTGAVTITNTGGGSGSYSNSNVIALMAAFGNNPISTTGNIIMDSQLNTATFRRLTMPSARTSSAVGNVVIDPTGVAINGLGAADLLNITMAGNCRVVGSTMALGESAITVWQQPATGGATLTVTSTTGNTFYATASSLPITTTANTYSIVKFQNVQGGVFAYVEATGLVKV